MAKRKQATMQDVQKLSKKKRDYGLILVDLHSTLSLIAVDYDMMRSKLSGKFDTAWLSDGTNLPVPPADKRELEAGFSVRQARENIQLLRESFPEDCLLRDISSYYRNCAVEHQGGYWLHGFIPLDDYLQTTEMAIDFALSGKDFRQPFRNLNENFPYEPSWYWKYRRRNLNREALLGRCSGIELP